VLSIRGWQRGELPAHGPGTTGERHGCVRVELPGHDVAAGSEPYAPMERVVEQVVAEITARGLKEVLLWGHSSGTAFAVETAKRLQERGVEVQRVFLAAQLLGDAADRRASIIELTRRSSAHIVTDLSADSGYTELGELDAQRAEHVAAAYRHDCLSAYSYFADALESPPVMKLSAPVTVVVAADDPITSAFHHRYGDWGAPGRTRRAARNPRRRPLLRAYPTDPGGTGRARRRQTARLLLIGN
jgi:surfactin synthase thioesterase subunit